MRTPLNPKVKRLFSAHRLNILNSHRIELSIGLEMVLIITS
jgi:hypothetical protein